MRSREEGQREGSDPGREDMPTGPIWNPHAYWRGHRPILTPTPTAGVTGPGLQDLMTPLPRDPGAA